MPVKLAFKPVTKATAGDFEALFASPGGPRPCWAASRRTCRWGSSAMLQASP